MLLMNTLLTASWYNKLGSTVAAFLAAFYTPIIPFMIGLVVIVLCDLALKCFLILKEGKEKLSWKKAAWIFAKIGIYLFVLTSVKSFGDVWLVDIEGGTAKLAFTISFAMASFEIISVFKHLYLLTGLDLRHLFRSSPQQAEKPDKE